MNKTINVEVRNKLARQTNDTVYVCGNDDFVVVFDFDDEWAEFTHKTARFVCNGTFVDIIFEGNQCTIPVISNTYNFYVGVYAGDLRTTTPAYIGAKKSILCGSGSPAEPPDDVYNQIMELIEGLGDPDPEVIARAVADYMAEHPATIEENDPTVPAWAKVATKPAYTAAEVGADPVGSADAALKAAKDNAGTQVSAHNVATDSHNDIRLLIAGIAERLNALANSDDTTLDQMAEVVAYIKDNRELIEQVTTGKVSVSDIIDNLTTNVANKPLSAAQGVALKGLVDDVGAKVNNTEVWTFELEDGSTVTKTVVIG